jgi:hypothetical protein
MNQYPNILIDCCNYATLWLLDQVVFMQQHVVFIQQIVAFIQQYVVATWRLPWAMVSSWAGRSAVMVRSGVDRRAVVAWAWVSS